MQLVDLGFDQQRPLSGPLDLHDCYIDCAGQRGALVPQIANGFRSRCEFDLLAREHSNGRADLAEVLAGHRQPQPRFDPV